ncbi:MAG: DUF2065 domain-containing protein [Gammaproteobacteria bacterium TMED119]|nr:MAG: DUF2065 domain-containing protein [Gammaproteobacteria bacterium TMED119]RCL45115.1 MAG: DUF2065 domain-containing protein [Candidatus Thioglobus sp.]
MFEDLLAAIALVLILEGLLPFASPKMLRRVWISINALPDRTLRLFGLVSMLSGVLFLSLIR